MTAILHTLDLSVQLI